MKISIAQARLDFFCEECGEGIGDHVLWQGKQTYHPQCFHDKLVAKTARIKETLTFIESKVHIDIRSRS